MGEFFNQLGEILFTYVVGAGMVAFGLGVLMVAGLALLLLLSGVIVVLDKFETRRLER